MIRVFRAELIKMWRPRAVFVALLLTVVYAVGATALAVTSVTESGFGEGFGPTPTSMALPGGGTEPFTSTLAFVGFFLLVAFAGATAIEFTRGTMRTMVLRQPARLRLLAGKLTALLASAAVLLALAMVLSWITARLIAPSQGIDTGRWLTVEGLSAAGTDYGRVLLWVVG